MYIDSKSLPEKLKNQLPLVSIKKELEKSLQEHDTFEVYLRIKGKDNVMYGIGLEITDYYTKKGHQWSVIEINQYYTENLFYKLVG